MKTYQHLGRLIRYRPVLYICDGLIWTLVHVAPLLPGLLAQQFFNLLPQAGGLDGTLWAIAVS